MKSKGNPDIAWNILRALTAALIAAFVLCGAWGHKVAHCLAAEGTEPLASTDLVFAQALGVDHGAEKITDALSGLAPGRSLALLSPKDSLNGAVLQVALSSITWPRKICIIQVTGDTIKSTFESLHPADYAAVLVFGFAPPPDPANGHVGPLTIIPTRQ